MKSELIYIFSLLLFVMAPQAVQQDSFVKIQKPLAIKTHKEFPPYLAHQELHRKLPPDNFSLYRAQTLSAEDFEYVSSDKKLVLAELTLTKDELPAQVVQRKVTTATDPREWLATEDSTVDAKEWMANLPRHQKLRLEIAERDNKFLTKEVLSEQAAAAFASSGAFSGAPPPQTPSDSRGVAGFIAKNDYPASWSGLEDPRDRSRRGKWLKIQGAIEMTGGLAVTNEHHIEIRRMSEGIFQERGEVSLKDGVYKVSISEMSGQILGRLINRKGETLGEGFVRLYEQEDANLTDPMRGPKLVIRPLQALSGSILSQYDSGHNQPVMEARATYFAGTEELTNNGVFSEAKLERGSKTNIQASAKGFLVSQKIVTSGQDVQLKLLPESMVTSLRSILSEQRQMDLTDPEGSIVWGQVTMDGKPLAGMSIEIESAPESEPIYFNDYFLPDPQLKTTAANGYFAFVQVPDGFHSLVAKRMGSYFSHTNTIVTKGQVSLVDMSSTLKGKMTTFKTFDAFTGAALDSLLEVQSLQEPLQLSKGWASAYLPDEKRMSLLRPQPIDGYAQATYQYDDFNDFVHVPLIQEGWIEQFRRDMRIDDQPLSSTIVGFVPETGFEAYLAVEQEKAKVYYFNSQGIKVDKPVPGGGFIFFNVPAGINEIVVYNTETGRFQSQVVPADPGSLSVVMINFLK